MELLIRRYLIKDDYDRRYCEALEEAIKTAEQDKEANSDRR
jgi:hypothetical protein